MENTDEITPSSRRQKKSRTFVHLGALSDVELIPLRMTHRPNKRCIAVLNKHLTPCLKDGKVPRLLATCVVKDLHTMLLEDTYKLLHAAILTNKAEQNAGRSRSKMMTLQPDTARMIFKFAKHLQYMNLEICNTCDAEEIDAIMSMCALYERI